MANLPHTFVVHTGRRIGKEGGKRAGLPVYGVHIYFRNAIPDGSSRWAGLSARLRVRAGMSLPAVPVTSQAKSTKLFTTSRLQQRQRQ